MDTASTNACLEGASTVVRLRPRPSMEGATAPTPVQAEVGYSRGYSHRPP